jgi:predicted site-specific integrase-resolvase
MKARKVLDRLNITRRTLNNYVKTGKIRVEKLVNGFYEYDDEDVYRLESDVVKPNRIIIYHSSGRTEFTFSHEQLPSLVSLISDFLKS